jgi:pilus assembly protein TadC
MSRKRRSIREQVQETFNVENGEVPPPDTTGRVLETLVAFVLGAGFWRLVVSDSWVASIVFGVLLAAVLFAYGLFRRRLIEDRPGRGDDRPPRG